MLLGFRGTLAWTRHGWVQLHGNPVISSLPEPDSSFKRLESVMNQRIKLLRKPMYVAVSFALSLVMGCAGATTQRTGQVVKKGSLARPPVMLVYDFAVAPDDAPPSLEIARAQDVAKSFSEEVVRKLEAVGITAQRATDSTPAPLHALVVKGQFVTIQEGSRAQRVVVGFGAGSTMLQVEVQLYQMTGSGLQRISEAEGEARGSRMPGVALPAGAAAATGFLVPLFVKGGLTTVREIGGDIQADIDRLAERFAYKAVAFYHRQGWI